MATNEPTNTEKIRGLRWSVAEIAVNTVFVQFTYFGSVFILFLNELQLNKSQIGLLLSFFPFFGLVALFIAPQVGRFGYKRTFVLFWTLRKFVTALLLLVPWVLSEFGPDVTLVFVALIVMTFGLCRAIAEVGYYPWNQEFVPSSMRGRYSAVANLFGNTVGIISILFASFVIEQSTGLDRFMFLFAIGLAFGFLGVWLIAHVPGGAAVKNTGEPPMSYRDMFITFQDRNFWLFIVSLGMVTLGTAPMFSFLPLFMEQEVGLSDGNTVLIQNGTLIGALVATFIVGWSSDRYGSKPVMLSGLAMIVILPVIWLFIPKNSSWSLTVALGAAVLQGIATLTWGIGSNRLLFVNVIPSERKAPYMAVFYATIGIIGGVSQLLGGAILDLTEGLSGQVFGYTYNPFTPIFIMSLLLLVTSLILFRYVRSDSEVSTGQFAGMFIRGNPLMAFESLVGYYRAKDERSTVAMTQRLGNANSPLAVDELLEALHDPRYNVRFEAIISIARTNPDPRYVEALGNILHGTELSLSAMAAWALGRIGDSHAQDSLRKGLHSEYKSIRAQCARSLGTLHDRTVASLLLERLQTETDKGLQMAYAVALGSMGYRDAVPCLLEQLNHFENEGARMELALSLARIHGAENNFIRLLRNMRRDPGTTAAQTLTGVRRKLRKTQNKNLLDECIDLMAHQDMDAGAKALAAIIDKLPDASNPILQHCKIEMETHGYQRPECLILTLHILSELT